MTPWTITCQPPLSMRFSKKEYWSGSHSLLQGIVLTQRSNLGLSHCWQILYHISHQRSPYTTQKGLDRSMMMYTLSILVIFPLFPYCYQYNAFLPPDSLSDYPDLGRLGGKLSCRCSLYESLFLGPTLKHYSPKRCTDLRGMRS